MYCICFKVSIKHFPIPDFGSKQITISDTIIDDILRRKIHGERVILSLSGREEILENDTKGKGLERRKKVWNKYEN